MNSKQRVRAAVEGRDLDRVPICLWHHFKPHGSPVRFARSTFDFFGGLGYDIFKIMPDIPYPFPEKSIRTVDDWLLISRMDPYAGNLGRTLQTLSLVKDAVGDDAPVVVTVFSPFTYIMQFAPSFDLVREHMTNNPIELHNALAVLAQNIAKFCEAAIHLGADGVYFAAWGMGDNLLSAQEYAEFARPYDLQALAGAQAGWLTALHIHAASGLTIDPFLAYPTPVLSWSDRVTGVSLREVRQKAPERCLMGGISEAGPILSGDRMALQAEIQDALAQAGTMRFILANGCSVPDDVPDHYMKLARELLDEVSQLG
jgi:uroporphyrinogen decarboxylase